MNGSRTTWIGSRTSWIVLEWFTARLTASIEVPKRTNRPQSRLNEKEEERSKTRKLKFLFPTVQHEIFISENFRQKLPSGSLSGIYIHQTSVVARLLFSRSVVALLLIVYLHIHEHFWSHTCGFWKKNGQDFHLVNCLGERDKIKFLTKISCKTVPSWFQTKFCMFEENAEK